MPALQTSGLKSDRASTAGSFTFAMPSSFAAGNSAVVACTAANGANQQIAGVTIGGTAATLVQQFQNGNNTAYWNSIWLAQGIAGGTANVVVTYVSTAAAYFEGSCEEWLPLAASAFDVGTTGQTLDTSSVATLTMTTAAKTQPGAIVYATGVTTKTFGSSGTILLTGPAGGGAWTQTALSNAGNPAIGNASGYRQVNAAGAESAVFTISPGALGSDISACIAVFKLLVVVAPKPTGWKKFQLSTIFSAVAALIAPFVQSNAVILGTPTVGFPVSFVTASMGGYLAPTRTGIQWTLDGVNIAGATGSTYTPIAGDATHALRVVETWSNASGTATSTSATVTVNAGFMYVDPAFPTFTTKHGYGNLANGRADLRPIQKRILVDGTTATNGNYFHVATVAAAKAIFASGDWILMPGGQSGTVMFGELWTGVIALNGTSNQNPFVLGTFDPADKENDAKFNTLRYTWDASGQGNGSVCIYGDHGIVSNIAIVNQIFKSNGTASDAGAIGVGIVNAQSHFKLFENCLFDGTIFAIQSNNTVTTPFVNTLDSTLANDTTVRFCGFMYANGFQGARSGNIYSDSCRRLRLEACVDMHGGWSRGMTRSTPAWAGGSAVLSVTSITSVGTTATATTAAPHGLTTGYNVIIGGASDAKYNVSLAVVTVTGASTFTYTIVSTGGVAASGTLTWQNYSSNGWTSAAGSGPDGFKHGMYITENNDDVQILNCVTGADAANLKFTGGNYRLQNLVILDSPMAFIYAAQGNSLASWPGGSSFKCDNLLQIGSDDQQTAPLEFAYRGWLPHIYSCTAGSYLKNALMLNATDPNGTNRQAVLCSSNGSGTATALLMDNTVTANWAVQDTTVNPDASTTVTFTNNIWQAPSSGSNLITTATPAAYQTKLANALTLTAGNSLRTAYPAYFSTVVVGANVRATTLNMLEFMGKNTIPDGVGGVPNPWCSLAQTHFRSALA